VLLALCAVAAPVARADGDPASDWLLQRFLFIPPDTGVSSGDSARLTSLLHSAHAQGYTLHVAVIPTRYDMGSVTVLFGKPRQYAPFLSQELRFFYKGRVLVVMKNGYAIARNGRSDRAEQQVLDTLALPVPFRGAALAAATETAIRRLAAHAGVHVVAAPIKRGGGSSTTRDRILIGAGAAVLLALAAVFSVWRRSGASARRRAR
jgi:hypothetical protein